MRFYVNYCCILVYIGIRWEEFSFGIFNFRGFGKEYCFVDFLYDFMGIMVL